MKELHELTGTMCALKNVEEVELVGMPKLKRCTLMGAFKSVKSVKMENAGKFESSKVLKEAMEKEKRRQEEKEKEKKGEEERRRREEQERNREMEQMKSEIEAWKREEEEKRKKEIEAWKRTIEDQKKKETEELKRTIEEQKTTIKELERTIEEQKNTIEELKKQPSSSTPSNDDRVVWERKTLNINRMNDLEKANCYIGGIVIASNCCNDTELTVLNLKRFESLRSFEVGDECFKNVEAIYVIEMKKLEKLVIGKNCFTKDYGRNDKPKGEFYVDGCEKLRELKIGEQSFSNYSICEIENVENLQLIEMGGYCFENVKKMKLIGLKRLVRLETGYRCFKNENDSESNGVFNLKDCEALRVLRLGIDSFEGYSECTIEGVNSLEVIEMKGSNFHSASLELKSAFRGMK